MIGHTKIGRIIIALSLMLVGWRHVAPQTLLAQTSPPVTTTVVVPMEFVQEPLVIGTSGEATQQALGTFMSLLLLDQGIAVTNTTFLDSESLLTAVDLGQIDLAIARPVDALTRHYGLPLNALPTDSERLRQLVDSQAAAAGTTWLTPTLLSQNYALMSVEKVEKADAPSTIISLPQLASFQTTTGTSLTICADEEDGALLANTLAALEATYTIHVEPEQQQLLSTDKLAQALATGSCDLYFGQSMVHPTDLAKVTLHALPDPDQFFPPNQLMLVTQRTTLAAQPAILRAWDALARVIDEPTVAQFLADESPINNDSPPTGETQPVDGPISTPESAYQFLLTLGLIQLPTITVGSRDETTQQLMGAMIVQLLQAAGYPVIDQTGTLGTADVVAQVESGDADIVIALLGDMLTIHSALPLDALPKDVNEAMQMIKSQQSDQSLAAMNPAAFSLTKVLIVDKDLAGLGITTISRLATYMNSYEAPFSFCVDSDFFSHPVMGLSGLEEFYGFHFDPNKILLMDEDTIFPAIQERQCQVTVGTITDGRVAAWHLLPLRDDKGFFPLNNPLPVTRQPLLTRQPRLAEQLERYLPYLDTTTMQQLTSEVELGADGLYLSGDEASTAEVAKTFLATHQLLVPTVTADNGATSGLLEIDQLDAGQLEEFEELPGLPNARRLNE